MGLDLMTSSFLGLRDKLHCIALRYLQSDEEAQDVLQDTWLKLSDKSEVESSRRKAPTSSMVIPMSVPPLPTKTTPCEFGTLISPTPRSRSSIASAVTKRRSEKKSTHPAWVINSQEDKRCNNLCKIEHSNDRLLDFFFLYCSLCVGIFIVLL